MLMSQCSPETRHREISSYNDEDLQKLQECKKALSTSLFTPVFVNILLSPINVDFLYIHNLNTLKCIVFTT